MNRLILSTGTNIGDKVENLKIAKNELSNIFEFVCESKIYASKAIIVNDQPDFLNQVLEFELPTILPQEAMKHILEIEKKLGRNRILNKGPRVIDIDIIFWGESKYKTDDLIIPHYDWFNRSFVCLPLKDLSSFQSIQKCFTIPTVFSNEAFIFDA